MCLEMIPKGVKIYILLIIHRKKIGSVMNPLNYLYISKTYTTYKCIKEYSTEDQHTSLFKLHLKVILFKFSFVVSKLYYVYSQKNCSCITKIDLWQSLFVST